MPWYAGKGEIREYLRELNKDKKASPNREGTGATVEGEF
jgi:hypothetical protein